MHASQSGRTGHIFDHQRTVGLDLVALFFLDGPHRQTQRALTLWLGSSAHRVAVFFLELGDLDGELLDAAIAPHFDLRFVTRLDRGDHGWHFGITLDQTAIDAHDDVTGLDPAFVCRATSLDRTDERTARTVQAEAVSQLRINLLDADADATATDLAALDELLAHVIGDIDGNRKRQTHVAAGLAVNLRVDADDFTVHVEQRTTGITGIDRHVGLNKRHISIVGQRTRRRADDARGHAVLESKGRTDSDNPLTGLEPRRITDFDGRQIFGIDLDNRHIGARVLTDDLGRVFAPVNGTHDHI